MKLPSSPSLALLLGLGLLGACSSDDDDTNNATPADQIEQVSGVTMTEVATSPANLLWTGVAVSQQGKVFACFPRMDTDTVPYAVASVSGSVHTPFPDTAWNNWKMGRDPRTHFICVQSVTIDDENFLWVLDPASPLMRGVVPGGAKLLKFNPQTGALVQRIDFTEPAVYGASFLNDVRIDTQNDFAYITDSNLGAIVVVNLTTGQARRVLANNVTTKSENLTITVEDRVWRNAAGELPSLDSDGLALSPARDYLYYHALTANSLYRIGTQWLRDPAFPADQLNTKVEEVADTEPTDGMETDAAGNLYLSTMQRNAIQRRTPAGKTQQVAQDARLKWPDSFARGADGSLYVANSQLHIPRRQRTEPFRIFRLTGL